MIDKNKNRIGTPIGIIYSDEPKKERSKITVAVPGTSMVMDRKVTGHSLRERANAAGMEISRIVSNFIENNPILEDKNGYMEVVDRTASYIAPVSELEDAADAPESATGAGPKPVESEDAPEPTETEDAPEPKKETGQKKKTEKKKEPKKDKTPSSAKASDSDKEPDEASDFEKDAEK